MSAKLHITEVRRRLLPGMLDRILEIDREQQGSGCPDESIADFVALLRTAGARALRPPGELETRSIRVLGLTRCIAFGESSF
jgi:hypothetical protein